MKIRIYDDSVRLRLDRSEVEAIERGEQVLCRTRFPGGVEFSYRLACAQIDAVAADFADGCITVTLPTETAQHWASDESEVSIRGSAQHAEGALALLIEKDFECLEPRAGEDQNNRFVNPKALTGAATES